MNLGLDLSVLIVNWNTCELLRACLHSLGRCNAAIKMEIIVVDNASTDDSLDMLRREYPHVRLIANRENVGFAKANNQAMQVAEGQYFLLLNSDAEITPGTIEALVSLAQDEQKAGIVGARLLNPDGSFQASYTPFPNLMREFLILSGLGRLLLGRWYPSRGPDIRGGARQVDYVEGACLLVRRDAYLAAGGLDEDYFMYAEEVEWCYTMQSYGWQVWYQPDAVVIHHGGASSRNRPTGREADLYRSRVRFFRRHYGNFKAALLKVMIYFLTLVKFVFHRVLRWLSGNRRGRLVVSPIELATALREA